MLLMSCGHETVSGRALQPMAHGGSMQRQRVLLPIDGHIVAADMHLLADSRPPVVFLHGVMASLDLAATLFTAPDEESWIALSLPGHAPGRFRAGMSAPQIDAALFGTLMEAALAALIGDRQVIAAGWSLGGFTAFNVASRFPHRVAAVASLAGFAAGRRLGNAFRALTWLAGRSPGQAGVALGLRLAGRWPLVHRLVAESMTAPGARIAPETLSAMHAAYRQHDPESLAAVLAAVHRLDISPDLGAIRVPTWIAGGGQDPVVPVAETRRLAELIPHSSLTIYAEAGHLFFGEWPGLVADFAAWRRQLVCNAALREPCP
jgi:pimeloyl-ACP methyl ester carboxylesterase